MSRDVKKSALIQMRITPVEKLLIRRAACISGQKMTPWIMERLVKMAADSILDFEMEQMVRKLNER